MIVNSRDRKKLLSKAACPADLAFIKVLTVCLLTSEDYFLCC